MLLGMTGISEESHFDVLPTRSSFEGRWKQKWNTWQRSKHGWKNMNFLPETWILGSKFLTYLKQLSDLFRVESSNAFVKVQFKQVRLQTMWLPRRMGLPRISRNIKGMFVCLYLIFLWKNADLKKKKVHYLREWLHAVSDKYEEREYQLWQGALSPCSSPSSKFRSVGCKERMRASQGSLAPITGKQMAL